MFESKGIDVDIQLNQLDQLEDNPIFMRLASNTPIDSHLCNRAPPNLDLEQGQYQDRHGPIDVDESDRISQDVNSGFQVNSEAKQGQPQQHHHLEDPFDHMDLINYDYNMEECDRGSQG